MTNDFDKNGYIHLKGFLDENNCKELTNILQELVTQGKTRIAVIPNDQLKRLLFSNDVFLENFLETLSDKVYRLNMTNKMCRSCKMSLVQIDTFH